MAKAGLHKDNCAHDDCSCVAALLRMKAYTPTNLHYASCAKRCRISETDCYLRVANLGLGWGAEVSTISAERVFRNRV